MAFAQTSLDLLDANRTPHEDSESIFPACAFSVDDCDDGDGDAATDDGGPAKIGAQNETQSSPAGSPNAGTKRLGKRALQFARAQSDPAKSHIEEADPTKWKATKGKGVGHVGGGKGQLSVGEPSVPRRPSFFRTSKLMMRKRAQSIEVAADDAQGEQGESDVPFSPLSPGSPDAPFMSVAQDPFAEGDEFAGHHSKTLDALLAVLPTLKQHLREDSGDTGDTAQTRDSLHRAEHDSALPALVKEGLSLAPRRRLEWCLERVYECSDLLRESQKEFVDRLLQDKLEELKADSNPLGKEIAEWVTSTFTDTADYELQYNKNPSSPTFKRRTTKQHQHKGSMDIPDFKEKTVSVDSGTDILEGNFGNFDFKRNDKRTQSAYGRKQRSLRGKHLATSHDRKRRIQEKSGRLVFSQECENLLSTIGDWGLNVFSLDQLAAGRPVTALALRIMERCDLMKRLKIDPLICVRFFMAAENDYSRAVPYHNHLHAADVLHSCFCLLESPGVANETGLRPTDLETFAMLIAATTHDMGHPGYHPFGLLSLSFK